MPLELGVSTLCSLSLRFEDAIRAVASMNCDRWEVVDDGPHFLTPERRSFLKSAARDAGVKLSLHAPYASVNIAASNPFAREGSWKAVLESVEHARSLDCDFIVLHSGIRDAITFCFPEVDEPGRACFEFLVRVSETCSSYGVTPLVENLVTERAYWNTPDELAELIEASGAKLALDIPHAALLGHLDALISKLGSEIAYVHVSDNNLNYDEHLALGSGRLEWRVAIERLLARGFSGPIVVENLKPSDAAKSVEVLRSVLL